jgi:thioredoxin reductase
LDPQRHTLIIIGGGPIGIACALAAKEKGIDSKILLKPYQTNFTLSVIREEVMASPKPQTKNMIMQPLFLI